MAKTVVKLADVSADKLPADLKIETYFDLKAHPFAHAALFDRPDAKSVFGAISAIGSYAKGWLKEHIAAGKAEGGVKVLVNAAPNANAHCVGHFEVVLEAGAVFEPAMVIGSDKAPGNTIYVEAGAKVLGGVYFPGEGSIYVGGKTVIEPGVGVKGPTIIGKECDIRQGAYLRGSIVVGDKVILRGELKNVLMMDLANFPHPSYVGDSLCGYMTHFGNQATTANLGIYEGLRDRDHRKPLVVEIGGVGYDLGSPKMGVCLGDFSQLGCNSVTDPGTFLKPYTIAYALTRVSKGIYGPNEVLKNKPMEHGIIERAPLKPLQ
jgi:acetyltransferase-like isoleucine patch superfamily enzyme